MFTSLRQTSARSIVEKSSIEWERYQSIWMDYIRNWKQYTRWGQHLCNKLNITEEAVPGLFHAATVREANLLFWEKYRAD